MGDLKKLKSKMNRLLTILVLLVVATCKISYASWYEEPEIYETENIDSMWWLSKSKKEKLKIEQKEEIEKKRIENESKSKKDKKIKWLYEDTNISRFPKDKWEIIDDDNDGIAYNYYFDKDGFLLIDTITPDYKVVDISGREVDYDFRPIKYNLYENFRDSNGGIIVEESDIYVPPSREPAKVLLGEGVVLRNKERIYDNTINKNVVNYVDKSNRFIKEIKGTTYNEVVWKKCSSLKGNGGYVVFNNPNNNFNKISGLITTEYQAFENDGYCILRVYDADEYDKFEEMHHLYNIEELYFNNSFYKTSPVIFSFTFDRSVKRLRFEIETSESNKSTTCFIKDLKYGFSKKVFYDELIRKKEDEAEIEELKRLGIYVEDMWSFEALDEEGNVIEEVDDEETEHENENNDDYIGGKSYVSDEETKSYEDIVRDRNTGPAFDETLKNIKEIGPGIINIDIK